jgi:hypothetical protein
VFKQAKLSAGNVDELMGLWAADVSVSDREPPFVDHTHLYNTIDAIPVGGVPWQNFEVSYTGSQPDANVYFRDPRWLFQNMLANPTFAEDFDYTPMRLFDINGSQRYEHFMSGDWAWKQAACFIILELIVLLIFVSRTLFQPQFQRQSVQCSSP